MESRFSDSKRAWINVLCLAPSRAVKSNTREKQMDSEEEEKKETDDLFKEDHLLVLKPRNWRRWWHSPHNSIFNHDTFPASLLLTILTHTDCNLYSFKYRSVSEQHAKLLFRRLNKILFGCVWTTHSRNRGNWSCISLLRSLSSFRISNKKSNREMLFYLF